MRPSSIFLMLSIASTTFTAHGAMPEKCSDKTTTNDVFQCLVREFAHTDQELNRTWATVQQLIQERGASLNYKKAFTSAQVAWLRLRDTECVSEGKEMEGGSLEKVIQQGCLVRKTKERTEYLKNRFSL